MAARPAFSQGSNIVNMYAAYAASTCEGTATMPLGYDAQYTSTDTGLIYLRARTYDPATGQFLSVDPVEQLTRAPYNYTGDNPVNKLDRTGLAEESEICFLPGGCTSAPWGSGAPGQGVNEWAEKEWASEERGLQVIAKEGERGIESAWNAFTGEGEVSQAGQSSECGFDGNQDALIKIAKEAKRNGLSQEDAQALREWAEEYDVPFRGPEEHPGRPIGSQPHIHVGSQNHIPVW